MPARIRPGVTFSVLATVTVVALLSLAAGRSAVASVSLSVTWDALLRGSSSAAVVTPIESRAVWEGGRICTYTHLHVQQAVAGDLAAGDEPWVRTLGGVVGKVGQVVDGEAVFAPGRASLVFLRPGPVGALDVTARGQGQFPVVSDTGTAVGPTGPASAVRRVVRSNATGSLLAPRVTTSGPPPALAAEVLHGRTVDDAIRTVTAAWTAAHAQ
jgi:hypothetical protein